MSKDRGLFKRGKTWYIRYRHQGVLYREAVGESKTEAREALAARQTQLKEGKFFDIKKKSDTTWEELIKEFKDWAKANKKPKTYECYCDNIKALNPFFQGKKLSQIKTLVVEKFKQSRLNKNLKPATVNRDLACIKRMFNLALKWGKADANPAQPVEFLRENNGRLRYLEKDRIEKLLDNCSSTLENMVELVLNTGLRKSELLHLKWRDIDLKNKLLFVWDTKNKESKSIPLNNRVVEVFKRIPRNLKSEYVFPSPVDQSKPWVDIRKEWSKALKKTNIENFTFHDLRHTFASHLVMAGVDLKTVQELLGHKRIEMTLRYTHLSPSHKRRGVDILCKHYEERIESIPKVSQAHK